MYINKLNNSQTCPQPPSKITDKIDRSEQVAVKGNSNSFNFLFRKKIRKKNAR